MKYIFTTLVSILFLNGTFSQVDIKVQIKEKKFYDKDAIAFVVEIPQAKYKLVVKAWTKYLKDSPKEKIINDNGVITINNKYLQKIATDSLDINSYIKEYSGYIVLAASFKLRGKYISNETEEEIFYPTRAYIRNFAVEQYKKAVKSELRKEQEKLKKLEGDFKSLINNNDIYHDAIKKSKRDILNLKDQITLIEIDMSSKVLQIQTQKEVVYRLVNTPGDEEKEAKKNLKKIESEFKKMQNKNKTFYNKIDVLEAKIRVNDRSIDQNEKEQKILKLVKEDQEYIVRKVQKKLKNIE